MSPNVASIPPPLAADTAWPGSAAPMPAPDGAPRISVVTPSYNQGAFLERTLRSVLLQGYPHVQLIVMDGGSTDDSVAIIRHYAACLDHWESQPDRGQSDAINRGMRRATGDLLCWLNSDDYLLPGALATVARLWNKHGHPDWISGACRFLDEDGRLVQTWTPDGPRPLGRALAMGAGVPQPSSFWTPRLWNAVGGVDDALHYSMDEDLWMRFYLTGARPVATEKEIAVRFMQRDSKTARCLPDFSREFVMIARRHARSMSVSDLADWNCGARSMAEQYGISSASELLARKFRGAFTYLASALRLAPDCGLYGFLRVFVAAIKRAAKGRRCATTDSRR